MSSLNSNGETALVDLALESWRFQKLFARALEKLDTSSAARFTSQHRFFLRRIEETLSAIGLRFVILDGQPFDAGTAAKALNIEDFEPGDNLVVEQMIEPIIMSETGLARQGTVILRKADR